MYRIYSPSKAKKKFHTFWLKLQHWCCEPNQMNLTVLIYKLYNVLSSIFYVPSIWKFIFGIFLPFFHLINRYMGCHAKIFLDIVKRIFWVSGKKLLWWYIFQHDVEITICSFFSLVLCNKRQINFSRKNFNVKNNYFLEVGVTFWNVSVNKDRYTR